MVGKGQVSEKDVKRSHKPSSPQVNTQPSTANQATDAVQRSAQPDVMRAADVTALQRSGGNMAVQRMLGSQLQRAATKTEEKTASKPKLAGKKFADYDAKQYRISGRAPNRKIEEVQRSEEDDGSGKSKVVYYALGEVVDFKGKMPRVSYYATPVSLGNWAPGVTHVNGMNVAPESGMASAEALQESINTNLDTSMKSDGVALEQSAIDVLYTYSAKRSNFFLDVFECIKGKFGAQDAVTDSQEQLMLDAVHQKNRVTVSAHSRGTIKTDNAVRSVYKMLSKEYMEESKKSSEVSSAYAKTLKLTAELDQEQMLDPELVADIASKEVTKQVAAKLAETNMNAYIQLIYAGNAVWFPTKVLKSDLYVGNKDFVSIFCGTYTKLGAKLKSKSKATLHSVKGGHGFEENYVKHVGAKIAEDILKR